MTLLIETIYGYSAQWVITGKGVKKISLYNDLKEETVNRIKLLNAKELKAVDAFIKSLEEISG